MDDRQATAAVGLTDGQRGVQRGDLVADVNLVPLRAGIAGNQGPEVIGALAPGVQEVPEPCRDRRDD